MNGTSIITLVLCLVAGVVLGGCATTGKALPEQIPQTMKAACDLYVKAKPDVIKLREYAKSNWAAIPPDVQQLLAKLDAYLPELDRAGTLLCAADASIEALQVGNAKKVNWDEVLSTVVRGAALAIELKQKGAF
jgi:hypothetical protein